MSKYNIEDLWNERYTSKKEVIDYSGRLMKKESISQPNSKYQPTIDHIRPLSEGGEDYKGNIEICHVCTNAEKGDSWNHWETNGKKYLAKRVKGDKKAYKIFEDN